MNKFIELSDTDNKSVLVNIDYIFKVSKDSDGNTEIGLSVRGYNDYPYQYLTTKMKYDTVRQIIDDALV